MKFDENYFKLFSQPQNFEINGEELKKNFRKLQLRYHPDKYIGSSPKEHRLAVQFSSYLNNAYATLINPIKRAEYLLEIKGISFDKENATIRDADFLIAQMELRDTFEKAKKENDFELIQKLKKSVSSELNLYFEHFSKLMEGLNSESDAMKSNILSCFCKMIFYYNFKEDLQ